ncbi:MAG: hypothetical protein NZ703_02300 [Gemmataceae bacterium]|nr:hypothetical protein [Gemmataceae bacterium]
MSGAGASSAGDVENGCPGTADGVEKAPLEGEKPGAGGIPPVKLPIDGFKPPAAEGWVAGKGPKVNRMVQRGQTRIAPAGNPEGSKTYEQLGLGHLSN